METDPMVQAFARMRDEIATFRQPQRAILDGLLTDIGTRVLEAERDATRQYRALDEERWRLRAKRDRAVGRRVELASDEGFDPTGCHVYILWGDDPDRPVYVGQSTNVLARLGAHLSGEKRAQVTRVVILRCANAAVMLEAEADLIRALRPLLNLRGLEATA